MLPVFAIYRSGNLTEEKANELFGPLTTALNVKTAFFYVGIVLTVVGLGVVIFGVLRLRRATKSNVEKPKSSIKISMQPQVKQRLTINEEYEN